MEGDLTLDAGSRAGDGIIVPLVPRIDLHTGYHGALCATPPAGYRMAPADTTHVFLVERDGDSPHREPHYGEFVEAGGHGAATVHTARWPVLGAHAWVADTDDLLYPVLCGRTSDNPEFRAALRSGDPDLRRRLRLRVENMLSAYLHPSCSGVLLRGHPDVRRQVAREWFEHLGLSALGDDALAKVITVRPAQRAADPRLVERKWNALAPIRVLFCGRDFETKNGLLALEVMAEVRRLHPGVAFTYVGSLPAGLRRERPALFDGIACHERLDHGASLSEMLAAHILFHPSRHESIGISLLEAMGAGAAVVAARGGEMEYSEDLFGDSGGLLVDRAAMTPAEEQAAFLARMLQAVRNPEMIAAMGRRNHEMTRSGPYSIEAQNRVFERAYAASRRARTDPLRLSDLPNTAGMVVRRLDSREVAQDSREYRRGLGLPGGYLSVVV
jgi:glycosyltransferase involved in cell wall biosynthesis